MNYFTLHDALNILTRLSLVFLFVGFFAAVTEAKAEVVRGVFGVPSVKGMAAKDVFSGVVYPVVNGKLTADFLSHQTLAFVIQ